MRRLHGDVGDGQGETEGKRISLQQRIAVAKEMTALLDRRLKDMHETNAVRQRGLAADQNPLTYVTYEELERERKKLADEQSAAALRPTNVPRSTLNGNGDAKLNGTTSLANGTSSLMARDDSTMPEEVEAAPVSLGLFRKHSLTIEEGDAAEAALKHKIKTLKRELQRIEMACSGRLIDSIVYNPASEPPIALDVDVVLKYAGYRISVPYNPKYFRYYLLHPLSKAITHDLFWFIHCRTFQSNAGFAQEVLVSAVADTYVRLSNKVTKNRTLFFQSYPYAVANAVCEAFYYFVPGSRNLYDSNFKLQVYVLIVRLLSGMEVCAVAVQVTLERLFTDEKEALAEAALKAHSAKSRRRKGGDSLHRSSTVSSIGDGDGGSDGDSTGSHGDGPDSDAAYSDEDELTTKALAGKVTDMDRKFLGPVTAHHVELLRSLPQELLVPNDAIATTTATNCRVPGSDVLHSNVVTAESSVHYSADVIDGTGFTPSNSIIESLPRSGVSARDHVDTVRTSASLANDRDGGGGGGLPPLSRSMSTLREPGVLRPTWAKQDTAADVGFKSLLFRSKKRQLRTPFCASTISPLVQRFLESDTSSIGRPVMLKRTTPLPWSSVGGIDTFHSTASRESLQASIQAELQAARAKYTEEMAKSRKEDSDLAKELRSQRNAVLHGSQAARTQFCSAITEQQERRRHNKEHKKSRMKEEEEKLKKSKAAEKERKKKIEEMKKSGLQDAGSIAATLAREKERAKEEADREKEKEKEKEKRRRNNTVIVKSSSYMLPAPAMVTAVRMDMSVVDDYKLNRSENPGWENFKASGFGWLPSTAAVEYKLAPPITTTTTLANSVSITPSVVKSAPESPKSESIDGGFGLNV